MKTSELRNKKFGNLKVIKKAENKGKNTAWECECSCGKVRAYLTYNLLSGKSKSCGCVRTNKLKKFATTHGESKTRLYSIYKSMKQRCYNKNNPAYQYYGEKGIEICEDWLNDFLSFKNWANKNGYTKSKSIDRIDPNKGYNPKNCRWEGYDVQSNNKTVSSFLIIDGEKKTIAQWAKEMNVNKQTFYSQFYRLFYTLGLNENDVKILHIETKSRKRH